MEICKSCDRDWIAHNENIILPDTGFFTLWTPSCPNAISSSQRYSCSPVILELGPICPSTCDVIAATMNNPQLVPAGCRRFVAKFIFRRALESVLYIQAAVEIVVSIMEKNDSVFSLRLNSCFDLLYIDRQNLSPSKYNNIIYFLKQIYSVLKTRQVAPEINNNQSLIMFLISLLRWSRLYLESQLIDSSSEMETFVHVMKSTSADMRNKLPRETKKLRSSVSYILSLKTTKLGVRLVLWDVLKLFPAE